MAVGQGTEEITLNGRFKRPAYRAGRRAYAEGQHLNSNPYRRGTEKHEEWTAGFVYERNWVIIRAMRKL